jgi:hypothetical protein
MLVALVLAAATVTSPASQDSTAASEVIDLINAAHAQSVFVQSTWAPSEATHVRSGLTCRFTPGMRENRIALFSPPAKRGDDVGCNTRFRDIHSSVFATRAGRGDTLQAAFHKAEVDLLSHYPAARPYTAALAQMSRSKDAPELLARRYVVEAEGRQLFTSLYVSLADGWVFSQRVSAPADLAMAADMWGQKNFDAAIAHVTAH